MRDFAEVDKQFAPIASAGFLAVLLLTGKVLRAKISLLRVLSLPASLIGGLLGMVFVMILQSLAPESGDWVVNFWMYGWADMSGFLINVIFATVFIGVNVPTISDVWEEGGPQIVFGQVITMGQYTIGLSVSMLLKSMGFAIPAFFGIILPAGFEGGHGTAAAFKDGYSMMGWEQGYDTTLMSATIGLVGGMLSGIVVINLLKMMGKLPNGSCVSPVSSEPASRRAVVAKEDQDAGWLQIGIIPTSQRLPAAFLTTAGDAMDSMALQTGIVFAAVFLAYAIKRCLLVVEASVETLSSLNLFSSIPLFPLCLIGGMIVSSGMKATGCDCVIDRSSMDRVAGLSLDVLILCAIARMNLSGVLDGLVPLSIVLSAGFAWMLVSVFLLAPLMLPNCPYHRALFEYGKCTGSTPIGMLLMKMADPQTPGEVQRSISYKLMIHEPFMGVWLTLVVLVLTSFGTVTMLVASVVVLLLWLLVFFVLLLPKMRPKDQSSSREVGARKADAALDDMSLLLGDQSDPAEMIRRIESHALLVKRSRSNLG